jgi:hypothetical protein
MEMAPSIRRHASYLTDITLLTVKLKALHSRCFSSGYLKYHRYHLTSNPHVTTARASDLAKEEATVPSALLSPKTLSQ